MANKKIVLAVIASKKMLSALNLLPPFLDEDEECSPYHEMHLATQRAKVLRLTGYIEHIIPGYSAKEFKSHFRISRQSFDKLVPIVDSKIEKICLLGRPMIPTERQLLATLWILATPDSYRYCFINI